MKPIWKYVFIFTLTAFGLLVSNFPLSAQQAEEEFQNSDSERLEHIISGYAFRMPDSIPFEGAIITFSGAGTAIVSDSGFYSISIERHWSGTATPSFGDGGFYTFTPTERVYEDLILDLPDQNYSGVANTMFTISGKFVEKNTGEALANVEIRMKSLTSSLKSFDVITNEFGEYSFQVLPSYDYGFDPRYEANYYFEPITRSYPAISSNMADEDYTYIDFYYPIPPGWEYVSTGNVHIISVETSSGPNFCGVPLEIGDLLGVFYVDDDGTLACGGFTRWQDDDNMGLIAQGDDTQTTPGDKDGFVYAETFKWRVYSYAEQDDFPAVVEFKTGPFLQSDNKWYPVGLSVVEEVDAIHANQIIIPQGWSGLSSYTKPAGLGISNVLSPISDELVLIQDMTKIYFPAAGINTMGVWTYNKGYKIKVSEEVVLPMNGCPQPNKTINLAATWNLLPVLSKCPVNVVELFAPIIDKTIIVKEVAGTQVYWPELGIESLTTLEPGRAYYVAVSENTAVTFGECMPATKAQNKPANKVVASSPWGEIVPTGSNHVLAFSINAMQNLISGDYIGAFAEDNTLCGFVRLDAFDEPLALTIFGDDASTPEKDGFASTEDIHLRVFDAQTAKEFPVQASYSGNYSQADGRYTEEGLSLVETLKVSTSGINTLDQEVRFFPNPSTGSVEFTPVQEGKYQITIQNMEGAILLNTTISGRRQLDLRHFAKGVYVVKIENQQNSLIKKLILK